MEGLQPRLSTSNGESSITPQSPPHMFQNATGFVVDGSHFMNVLGNMNIHPVVPSSAVQESSSETAATASAPNPFIPLDIPDDVRSDSEVYCSQLLRRGRGFPLYVPEPQRNLPLEYRKKGVAIGDVGRVTPEGIFDFFFNIYLAADHHIHVGHIPENFSPLERYSSRDVVYREYASGNYVSTPSVMKLDAEPPSGEYHDEFPGGRFVFEGNAPQGAVLALPHGSQLQKLENLERMRRYAVENAESWYKYINGERGRGIANGSLYLVTGCEKARSWGMAAFQDITRPTTFRLSFNATADMSTGADDYRYRWTAAGSARTQESRYFPADGGCPDQTIFIHGFSISLGTGIWARLFRDVTLSQIVDSQLGRTTKDFVPYGSQGFSFSWVASFLGGSTAPGGKQYAGRANDPNGVLVSDISPTSKLLNPSQAINECLLAKFPNATVVISHDDDWADILRYDDSGPPIPPPIPPHAPAWLQRICEQFVLVQEDGRATVIHNGWHQQPELPSFPNPSSHSPAWRSEGESDASSDRSSIPSRDFSPLDPGYDTLSAEYAGVAYRSSRSKSLDALEHVHDGQMTDAHLDETSDYDTLGKMSPIHWQLPQFTQHDSRVPSSQPVGATPWDFFDDLEVCSPTHSSQPSKSRRGDLDLQLAPDQPPATKGKPRAYIACIQCRTRKIRCDGAKPICHNCGKRAQTDCNYDPLPKRRGPDKRPGARQRVAREKNAKSSRSPRRMTSSDAQECRPENDGTLLLRPFSFSSPSSSKKMHEASPPRSNSLSLTFPLEKSLSRTFITAHDNSEEHRRSDVTTITIQPSLDFLRKTWYDSLLSLYLSPASGRLESLSSAQRDLASQRITTDLRFLFRASNHWFSFLHAPTFFSNLFDASKRQNIQPSLILAALAMSTFWQSSEIQRGHQGRVRALRFRDEAQSAMEASFNAGWVDDTLAQAAWILAMFEVCPHPHYSTERSSSAMMVLDSIIRALSLTMVDDIDVDPHTSTSSPGKVPAIHQSLRPNLQNDSEQHIDSPSLPISTDPGCSCNTMTLGEQWSPAFEHTPLWTQTPAWSVSGSNAEIRLQSCRRLYWSAVILAAEHSAYSSDNRVDLFIGDPSNNALFSGEAIYSDTETIWGLYGRSLLLWLACIKMGNATAADNDKGQFAIKAWLEADTIEAALNRHTCNIERGFILEGREYIFNTRMCIIYEFQQFVPCCSTTNEQFQRHKVEEWLSHQANVAQNFMAGLHTITGNSRSNLYQQPFYVFRFMAQLSRGLTLWQYDNSMTVAFDVCKNLLAPIDFLTALWPCAEQRYRYESLRERLRGACDIAGIAPPPPLNLTLPINEFQ